MSSELKLLVCAGLSLVAHVVIARALEQLPPHVDPVVPHRITIAIVPPPEVTRPPPEVAPPPPAPEPPPLPPKPAVVQHARIATAPALAPSHEAPAPAPAKPLATPPTPGPGDFNVSMESSSSTGMPVAAGGGAGGGSGGGGAGTGLPAVGPPVASPGKSRDAPIGAYEATKLPLPDAHCHYALGKYTDAAFAAGTEGTVVVDLTVGEDGHPRDIAVVNPLPNGLTEAAIAALKACTFSPGEKNGNRVAVRIRGFKIVFVLPDHE